MLAVQLVVEDFRLYRASSLPGDCAVGPSGVAAASCQRWTTFLQIPVS